MSEVSQAEGNYYFTTTTLDQFKLQSIQHMYQLSNNKLTEIKNYALFLQLMTNHLKWIGVNGFWVKSKDYVVSLFHEATTTKEMIYTRTNLNFRTQHLKKTIKLSYYADFNCFCVLSNGHTVILQHNAGKTWSYYFYDNEMTLLKEVKTKVSKDHVPYALFESSKGVVSGVFNISNKYEKDCVVQEVRWKK